MLIFIVRRLVAAVVLFLVFTYVLWFLGTTTGFPMLSQTGLRTFLSPAYLTWVSQILHGNLGHASRSRYTVAQIFQMGLLPTTLIVIPAFLLQQLLAIPIGIQTAVRKGGIFDRIASSIMFALTALPPFWLALMAIIYLCVDFNVFPFNGLVNIVVTDTGFNTPAYWVYFGSHPITAFLDLAAHLFLPILIVALTAAAADGQYVRWSMLEVLNQEYIRVERASGFLKRRIIWKYALRNALLPIITNIGQQLPLLIIASGIVEWIFGIPGLGKFFIDAVYSPASLGAGTQVSPDLHVITGYIFFIGVIALLSSVIADIAYATADPRINTSML